MKSKLTVIVIFIGLLTAASSCKTSQKTTESQMTLYIEKHNDLPKMKISFINGQGYNYPTFVVWKESLEGKYLETIFITKSYASGIFGYEMQGDSLWKKTAGPSYQPAALPYWTHKKGLMSNKSLIPTPDSPFVDAYSGATPEYNFDLNIHASQAPAYKILVEVNQTWDWNTYWNNGKYPESQAYKHSAQPSLVYSVEINETTDTFYLNPIGHGDPTGESGKLFTDLSKFTTAKDIFQTIKIEFIP